MHAVVLAGGKGTRLRPLTDRRPKPLVPFAGDPFAAGLLRRLRNAGVTRATFLVGADPVAFAPLEDLGRRIGVPVTVVAEPEPLDTAGAARDLLRRSPPGAVLVCNGDILTDLDYAAVVRAHRTRGAVATLTLTRVEDTSAYGVVECDASGVVRRFVEKPPAGAVAADTVNAGTYVLEPAAFDAFDQPGPLSFERTVFPSLVASGAVVLGVVSDAAWLDLGTPERYLAGHAEVLTGRCGWPVGDDWSRRSSALVHRRAQLRPGAVLAGASVVGADSVVGEGARLDSAVLFSGVRVGAGASVTASVLDDGVEVAAGAVVGPGAVVPAGARVR